MRMQRRDEAEDRNFSVTAALLRLSRGKKRLVVGQIMASLSEGSIEAAILTLFARLALRAVDATGDRVFVPVLGSHSLSFGLFVLVILIFARLTIGLSRVFLSARLEAALTVELRNESLASYAGSSWESQSQFDDGDTQQLIVTLPNSLVSHFASLIAYSASVGIMISMLAYSMLMDALLTLFLVLVIVSSTVLFTPLRYLIKRSSSRVLVEQRKLSSNVATLGAIRFEVQAFGVMKAAILPASHVVGSEARLKAKLDRLKGSVVPVFTTLTYLAVSLSIYVLSAAEISNVERTGPILLVVLRSLSYSTAFQQLSSTLASVKPGLELFDAKLHRLNSDTISWGKSDFSEFHLCRLREVTFTYAGSSTPALRGASLDIPRGARVGLVGPSGSGKSTLVRLLLGIVQAQEGVVEINGKPIHELRRDSWAHHLGVVPQSAQVVPGSIAFNLMFYREGIREQDLWQALRIADLEDEVASLPEGIETVVGPGNRQLSGGQQQRLAIARAFANRPKFVVMDEPTSSIDAISESTIADAMERIPEDVTVIIVSHRLRILNRCDQLVVVEDGRISAEGVREVVLANSKYLQSVIDS